MEVSCDDDFHGRAAVPSGASTGSHEALELRDCEPKLFGGQGVLKAITNIHERIAPALIGQDPSAQSQIDAIMCQLDSTANKQALGANAILGVSMAVARLAAEQRGLPLYRYLGGVYTPRLPVPMINVINGGAHATNRLDFQEFMLVPHNAKTFSEALRWGSEIFHKLKKILAQRGMATGVGDEGGFAPDLESSEQALNLLMEAMTQAGFQPGQDVSLALDVAATELWDSSGNVYVLAGENKRLDRSEFCNYLLDLTERFPIISIEDGFAENDWEGFTELTRRSPSHVQVVGDDLFVTSVPRVLDGINKQAANAVLIKLNQIGTVSETLATVDVAMRHGLGVIISHRSGETEDTFIADLAVATRAGQIKTGSLSRSERRMV